MSKQIKKIFMVIVLALCIVPTIAFANGSKGIGVENQISSNYQKTDKEVNYPALLIIIGLMGIRGLVAIYQFDKSVNVIIEEKNKAKKIIENPSDETWEYKRLMGRIEKSFYKVKEAWEERNTDIAEEYMSKRLCLEHKKKVEEMIERNEKNILEDITLIKILPIRAVDKIDNKKDSISVAIESKATNYTINTVTGKIVQPESGEKPKSCFTSEVWTYIKEEENWVLDEIKEFDCCVPISRLEKY